MRKSGGREGNAKVAVALRRLMNLSKEVEGVEGADLVRGLSLRAQDLADAFLTSPQTRDTIEKYCERFEKDMLRLFDRYYRKGEPEAMAVRPSRK